MSFTHLHLHTYYSVPMDGKSKPDDVIAKVKELGQTAVAFTDHGTTSGLMEGYQVAKKNGVKFIFGAEFYFSPEITIKNREEIYHLVILAKNNVGYKNLLRLMTIAHSADYFYAKPRIDFESLEEYGEGLIVMSACMGGVLKRDDAEQWASKFKGLFADDYYIEIHTNSAPEQKTYNHRVIGIAQKLGIPLVATCDSHYVNKDEASTHRKWVGINEEDNENGYYQTDDFYIMSAKEVHEALLSQSISPPVVDIAIQNTQIIAEQCDVVIDFGSQHYPEFRPPDGYTQVEYFKHLAREGWKTKIAPKLRDHPELRLIYAERVRYELDTLEKANYVNYFLITHDIVDFCHRNNIRVGVGRGSVVASLVSYLLGITGLDPVQYGLIFERFCHLERITAPDKNNVERYGNIAC